MKKFFILIALTNLFLCAGFVWANDTAGALLPTGEIRFEKQPGIVLKHEALLLSDTVTVDYLFENTTDSPVETTVFFPIPTVGPLTAYWQAPHDFKFRVWSDGQEIIPSLSRKITLHEVDVTRFFDLMGVTDYMQTIQTDPDTYGLDLEKAAAPLRKLPLTEQKEMEKLGMLSKECLEKNENGKCTHNSHIYHLVPADYRQEVLYYWMQTFPAHQTVHIRHEYKPSFLENSVGEPSQLVQKTTDWDYDKPHDFWKEASYIITTANNWKKPIGQFDLLIWGGTGAAVSAYANNRAFHTRVAPANYLLEKRQDFVPTQEILFELASANAREEVATLPQLYRVDGPANVRATPDGKKINTLRNGRYVWAYPSDKKDWFVVLLDEKTIGYTYYTNLIPFGGIN